MLGTYSCLALMLSWSVSEGGSRVIGTCLTAGLRYSLMRIATLDSIKGKGAPRDTGGDSDDDAKESYVGGTGAHGGGSGLNVVDPPNEDRNFVGGIFQRAQQAAAGDMPPPPDAPGARRTITMYANGFTVDDGPFRTLEDPANEPFLRDLARGIVPRELEESSQNQAVHVNLVDKRQEEYKAPPPPSYVAYSGEGKTAGAKEASKDAVVKAGSGGSEPPVVDETKPTTTIQIVLANGKKLTKKFNLTHTIQHIQAVIASEGGATAPYRLLTGFPPAELTDFGRTIEAAGLKSARITQKFV